GVPRDSLMAQTLFAVDELCGFLVACALVRPSKSFVDLEVSSVKKKLKDKGFARGVNRDEVNQGAAELGVPLDEHIAFVIRPLRSPGACPVRCPRLVRHLAALLAAADPGRRRGARLPPTPHPRPARRIRP